MNEKIQLRIRWDYGHPFLETLEDGKWSFDCQHAAEIGFSTTPPDAAVVIDLIQDRLTEYRRIVVPDYREGGES